MREGEAPAEPDIRKQLVFAAQRELRPPYSSRLLCDDFSDGLAVIDVETFSAGDFESPRIKTELIQHRGVDVGDVMAVHSSVKTEFVGCSVYHTPWVDLRCLRRSFWYAKNQDNHRN